MKAVVQPRPPRRISRRVSPGTRPAARDKAHRLQVRSILVPIDFSPPSMKALEYALQLASAFKAKLTMLHVLEILAVPEFATYPIVPDAERLARMRKELTAVAKEHGCDRDLLPAVKVRAGVPFREITNAAASLKSDLIIIATHGYSGLAHVFLGSTAERVVRHASCPVLVVPARALKKRPPAF